MWASQPNISWRSISSIYFLQIFMLFSLFVLASLLLPVNHLKRENLNLLLIKIRNANDFHPTTANTMNCRCRLLWFCYQICLKNTREIRVISFLSLECKKDRIEIDFKALFTGTLNVKLGYFHENEKNKGKEECALIWKFQIDVDEIIIKVIYSICCIFYTLLTSNDM